jgi:hypothetical protein
VQDAAHLDQEHAPLTKQVRQPEDGSMNWNYRFH